MAVIGIDLGTTNSLVVVYKNDHYEFIPNGYNEFLTPSVVSVDNDGNVIVGKIAKQRLVTHPSSTIALFKRNMGKDVKLKLGDEFYLPEELSAFVVKQLMEDAKVYLHEEIDEIIISVPAYFDNFQRNATKRIGTILGVKIERLINEPSAAALACHKKDESDESFIVFDFGGGTLDVSVVDCFDNVISICAIAGDNQLGGSDFDLAIAKDFCLQHSLDYERLSTKNKGSLLLHCEQLKIDLQDKEIADMDIHIDGSDYHYVLEKDDLLELSTSIFNRIRRIVARAVNHSGFKAGEIDKMILVGGSCHMSIVTEFLMKLMNIPVMEIEDMDKVVAMGLGTYIGIKQRKESVRELVLTDICPFSLGNNIHNHQKPARPLFNIVIPRNSVLPISKTVRYYTVEKGQTEIDFTIYQGEEMYADDNIELGKKSIKVPKNMKENEAIEATFSYDLNSLLIVDVNVLSTKETYRYIIGDEDKQDPSQLSRIKNMSMQVNREPEIAYIREHLNRIIAESADYKQKTVKALYLNFERMLDEYDHNLRKRAQIIDIMNKNLVILEKEIGKCEFFDLLDEDNSNSGGGLLS